MRNPSKRKPKIRNRIRRCRTTINLGQKEAAFLMGVDPAQLCRWEKGEREPGIYNAIGLAAATNRLVEDIFLGYRQEWQEKIRERKKLFDSRQNKKEELCSNQYIPK